MSSNLILGMFAVLSLVIAVLVVFAIINMGRKAAHNKALLEAHKKAMEQKAAAQRQAAAKAPPAEAGEEEKAKTGAERNFTPFT